jgi:hypothetical protein
VPSCVPAGQLDHWKLRCQVQLVDAQRDNRAAGLDFLVYDAVANFAAEDEAVIGARAGAIHVLEARSS